MNCSIVAGLFQGDRLHRVSDLPDDTAGDMPYALCRAVSEAEMLLGPMRIG